MDRQQHQTLAYVVVGYTVEMIALSLVSSQLCFMVVSVQFAVIFLLLVLPRDLSGCQRVAIASANIHVQNKHSLEMTDALIIFELEFTSTM